MRRSARVENINWHFSAGGHVWEVGSPPERFGTQTWWTLARDPVSHRRKWRQRWA